MSEQMRCPICESIKLLRKFQFDDNSVFADKGKLTFLSCRECDFLFNPKGLELTPEDFKSYYQHDISCEEAVNKVSKKLDVYLKWRSPLFSFLEKSITLDAMKQMRILDIGGSSGQFCYLMMQKGLQCDLFDYSKVYVEIGKKKFQIKNSYTDMDQITEAYDLFILNHVIEHIANPVDYLRNLLKDHKNKHVFISTPNSRSIGSLLYRKSWLHLRDHHISLFSRKNISILYERAGLVLKRYDGFCMYSTNPLMTLKGIVGNLVKASGAGHRKFLITDGLCSYGCQK